MPRIPVFCDSPMAIKAVEIFLKHDEEYSDETRDMIREIWLAADTGLVLPSRPRRKNQRRSMRRACPPSSFLRAEWSPEAASCITWRSGLPDPRNLVLFIGFQAPGTRGFTIKSKSDEVKIFGEFRAHSRADRRARTVQRPRRSARTAAMAANFQNQPATTYLVHGEPDASASCAT